MNISVEILSKIDNIEEYNLEYNVRDAKIYPLYQAFKSSINFSGKITKDFLDFLASKQIISIPVRSNEKLLNYLREKYPEIYPKPNIKLTLEDLIERSEEYLTLNRKSHKQRRIIVLQDVYYEDLRLSRLINIIPYNSYIGEKSISAIKKYRDYPYEIEVLDSESGALVFVPDVKDFKLKVDLFAILSVFDFPIYDCTSVEDALKVYKEKSPKMVIIANLDSDVRSKEFLLRLEEYDPFVKKLNFVESPASRKDREIQRIKNYYYSGYKEVISNIDAKKEVLPEEIKRNILNSLRDLEENFSKESFYEKAYALKQFGRYFNITILWNMLKNIQKKYFID